MTMPSDYLRAWTALAKPPTAALKQIKGGRLTGMTDVNPQWRYKAMTAQYGPCGEGWQWTLDKVWTEPGTDGQVCAFALVEVSTRTGDGWSLPIPGIGGSMLIAKESSGLRTNDDAYKMAVTDALSVALKMLGVASEIYEGRWDGSKWKDENADQAVDATRYQNWLDDLAGVASGEGYAALVASVQASSADFQAALRSDKAAWADLKALTVKPSVP